jgi:hypothetical protein
MRTGVYIQKQERKEVASVELAYRVGNFPAFDDDIADAGGDC